MLCLGSSAWIEHQPSKLGVAGPNPVRGILYTALFKMKRVFLIHGWEGNPEEPLHKWIKKSLEARGFEVFVPEMPNADKPEIKSWINKIREVVGQLSKEDIFIGHSVGCQAILRYLESLDKNERVKKVILIAPWMYLDKKTIEEEGEEVIEIAKPWAETPIDFKKIKTHCDEFIAIFSDNDPYVPLSNINLFKENLNANVLILKKRGHFDPGSNINSLPELLDFLR
jgi:predicted alpha/beta hydrolase family esterase